MNYLLHNDDNKQEVSKTPAQEEGSNPILSSNSQKKQRLLARKGTARYIKPINSLAFFYADSKLCFTVDLEGNRFFLDETLSEIEKLLDTKLFFRITRQLIVHVDAIKEFRSIEFSKIELSLFANNWIKEPVVISQNTAPVFKKWISEL